MYNNKAHQIRTQRNRTVYKAGHPRFEKLSRYEYHKLTSSEESPRRFPPDYDFEDLDGDGKALPHCKYITDAYEKRVFPEWHREGSDDETTGWIPWYCRLPGNEFLVEVPATFIEDHFNMAEIYEIIEN